MIRSLLIFAFLISSVSHAQDINQAKKAIDAEKYEEAKSILKSIIQAAISSLTSSCNVDTLLSSVTHLRLNLSLKINPV